MSRPVKNVAILGSTGSIGSSTVEVLAGSAGRLRAIALSAHTRLHRLVEQARELQPKWVIATDRKRSDAFDWSRLPEGTMRLDGQEGVERVVSDERVDVVVAAMVGSAGLRGTWAALRAGKRVALANKETLVMAGPLATRLAKECDATILPVDSEHSAIFQAMQAGNRNDVRRVVLTASGGPFRNHSRAQLAQVTVADALAHPTWEMGPKITVDSATMMNKALEIIEARWLFQLGAEQIDVVVHPQSVVHSMVEFVDGSVIAQLSPPDMRLPIQYALDYPDRQTGVTDQIDWSAVQHFDFEPPDFERFPALELGKKVARLGGTAGAVFNAANEVAVAEFLQGNVKFIDIVPMCDRVLHGHDFDPSPSLDQLMAIDRWARQEVLRWVGR